MRGAETGITATAILSIAVNLSKKIEMRTNQYNMIYYDTTDKKISEFNETVNFTN